jgi:hypothetical protein
VNEEPYMFVDEQFMMAQEKWRVLRAWRRFIRGGFELEKFTEATWHHLIQHCSFIAHYDRGGFWDFYFNSVPRDLAMFLNQFGGDHRSAEYGGRLWLEDRFTGADLNRAMCQEMEPLYPTLVQVLDGLGRQYQVAVAQWKESTSAMTLFAPPTFRITAEIRALLATAAGQALSVQEAARPETVSRRQAVVLEIRDEAPPEQLPLFAWDAAEPGKAGDPLSGERCAVCRALPQAKPGMWYVIDGVAYCPDCVPSVPGAWAAGRKREAIRVLSHAG